MHITNFNFKSNSNYTVNSKSYVATKRKETIRDKLTRERTAEHGGKHL